MAALGAAPLQRYLERVGAPPRLAPTLPGLAAVHWAHLRTIAFENLSLSRESAGSGGGLVSTELPDIYSKLVLSKRGGYCFEQNGLLSAVLRGAGFDVLDTAARVVQSGAAPPADVEEAPPLPNDASELSPLAASSLDVTQPALELRLSGHDHHVLLVGIEGQLWLADVGFGGTNPPLPVLLPEGAERYAAPPADQTAADAYAGADWVAAAGLEGAVRRMQRFRLRLGLPGLLGLPDAAAVPWFGERVGYYLQHQEAEGGWRDAYFFRLDQFLPQDFSIANHYIENHPTSFFRQHRLACRLTDEGKVTLLDDCFRVMRDGEAAPVEERRLEGEGELREVLAQHFGVELP